MRRKSIWRVGARVFQPFISFSFQKFLSWRFFWECYDFALDFANHVWVWICSLHLTFGIFQDLPPVSTGTLGGESLTHKNVFQTFVPTTGSAHNPGNNLGNNSVFDLHGHADSDVSTLELTLDQHAKLCKGFLKKPWLCLYSAQVLHLFHHCAKCRMACAKTEYSVCKTIAFWRCLWPFCAGGIGFCYVPFFKTNFSSLTKIYPG